MFTQQDNKDNLFEIRQGDAYPISFEFYDDDGNLITPTSLVDLSISIGVREKRYSQTTEALPTITYYNGVWNYWLTQKDSYSLPIGEVPVSVMIKFSSTKIEGLDMEPMRVLPTLNKVIL